MSTRPIHLEPAVVDAQAASDDAILRAADTREAYPWWVKAFFSLLTGVLVYLFAVSFFLQTNTNAIAQGTQKLVKGQSTAVSNHTETLSKIQAGTDATHVLATELQTEIVALQQGNTTVGNILKLAGQVVNQLDSTDAAICSALKIECNTTVPVLPSDSAVTSVTSNATLATLPALS